MEPLSSENIEIHLSAVPDWNCDEDASLITRTWTLRDFDQAMDFVNAVAMLAESENHHPKIIIDFKTVTLELSTHSVGGLTTKDFELAALIDQLPGSMGEVEKDGEDFLVG